MLVNVKANFPLYNKCRGTINKWRSLVPMDKIPECLFHIKDQVIPGCKTKQEAILNYFEKTWLNGVEHFKPRVWNHFDYIGPRTNNDLEGFNRQLNRY
jgi:hypothetical protein